MGKSKRYDQEYKDILFELFKSEMTVTEISREYGIARSTYYNKCNQYLMEILIDKIPQILYNHLVKYLISYLYFTTKVQTRLSLDFCFVKMLFKFIFY